MTLRERIGVSTDSLFGVSLDVAIDQICRAGFQTFELILADFQASGGFPCSDLNPGVWPRDCTEANIERLKQKLACFAQITVHAPHLGTMFGSGNPGVREEAERQNR